MKHTSRLGMAVAMASCSVLAQTFTGLAPAPSEPMSLWYRAPAKTWEGQVLPLGNGFLGASVFGGVDREEIQLNEHSLWTGGPGSVSNYTGGNRATSRVHVISDVRKLIDKNDFSGAAKRLLDTADGMTGISRGFGSYQNFGSLFLKTMDGLVVTASSENVGEGKENAFDGNLDSKWYTGSTNKGPFWIQLKHPKSEVINGYAITSANDVVDRDPRSWVLKGSGNGVDWVTLHTVSNEAFASRKQTKTYSFANSTAYQYYRFELEVRSGTSLQLAEIKMAYLGGAPQLYEVKDYRRDLDLRQAVAKVQYTVDGVSYLREYFASNPDSVVAVRITSNKTSAISTEVSLACARSCQNTFANGILTSRGSLNNGMIFESQTAIQHRGGTLRWNGSQAEIRDADTLILLFTAGTDYVNSYPSYKGVDPKAKVGARIQKAASLGFESLRARHIADYQSLFGKMTLDIGQTVSSVPTDELLKSYSGNSRMLEATYFQYGRYLLISSSRAGGLPANLQGIWNNSNYPPWNADYHTNINVQMNYWPAEMTNLAELHKPLLAYVDGLREPGRKTAQIHYGARGWVTHHENNTFGYTGPGTYPYAFLFPEAAAWLCQHYWDHFDFSRDAQFLSLKAYPVMKEAAEFWLDYLYADPGTGKLVVSPSYSPEHGDYTAGASMSQQIVWDLFNNTLEAARILKIDDDFTKSLKAKFAILDPGLRIGSWGQLQEWRLDKDSKTDQHRHVSHLYALHPGRQISPLTTPTYTNAAKVSLNARGDGGTGWSKAWKINFWARLHDGNHAHKMLKEQLVNSTLPNLWDTHPPFQIDGNFGATSGMAEMLLQSHAGVIHLLPALPDAWPNGRVTGMRAKGGFEIDFDWKNGKVEQVQIRSLAGSLCSLKMGPIVRAFATTKGGVYNIRDGQVVSGGLRNLAKNGIRISRVATGKYVFSFSQVAHEGYRIRGFDLRGHLIANVSVPVQSLQASVNIAKQASRTIFWVVDDGAVRIIAEKQVQP